MAKLKIGSTSGGSLIAVCNGDLQKKLNAEMLDGKKSSDYSASDHKHEDIYYNKTSLDDKLSLKSDKADFDNLGSASKKDIGTKPGNIPVVADNGKIDPLIIPESFNDTFVVKSEAEMLSLVALPGDIAVRTDVSHTFVLKSLPPSAEDNWIQISSGKQDGVITINGESGDVVLSYADVSAAASDHIHSDIYLSKEEIGTRLDGKSDLSHNHTIADITDFDTTGLAEELKNSAGFAMQSDITDAIRAIDKDNNGIVDMAEEALRVNWAGVEEKPESYPPGIHDHDNDYHTKEFVEAALTRLANMMLIID